MDNQNLGDNEISRRNHAVIVFDPKKRETVLLPGDANGIVYLNANALPSASTISCGDKKPSDTNIEGSEPHDS